MLNIGIQDGGHHHENVIKFDRGEGAPSELGEGGAFYSSGPGANHPVSGPGGTSRSGMLNSILSVGGHMPLAAVSLKEMWAPMSGSTVGVVGGGGMDEVEVWAGAVCTGRQPPLQVAVWDFSSHH